MTTLNDDELGDIDESGFLRGMLRKGFTQPRCLGELAANAIDAQANHIKFDISVKIIKMIDDGKGMTKENIRNMFSIHKENHAGEKTIGVSGVGAKPSTMILSEKTAVTMYTKTFNGIGCCVEIPYDKMFEKGKYTGMITSRPMNEKELIEFYKERETTINKNSGTTFCFKYNDRLKEAIEKQFDDLNNDEHIQDKLFYIYGQKDVKFRYKHYEASSEKTNKNYHYFREQNNEYYKGKSCDRISLYENRDGKKRYIWTDIDETHYEIKWKGNGYSKSVK